MSLYIPANITNIIFEYYSQMNNLRWTPFVDVKTGKLKWIVNKYSAKYDNINKLIKHRQENLLQEIYIDVAIVRNGETIDFYNTIGTSISIKTKFVVNKYQIIIPISYFYIEFTDEYNFKYSMFCSLYGRSIKKIEYEVYQDGNIHSNLIDILIFGKTNYSLVLEKY